MLLGFNFFILLPKVIHYSRLITHNTENEKYDPVRRGGVREGGGEKKHHFSSISFSRRFAYTLISIKDKKQENTVRSFELLKIHLISRR